MDDDIKTVLVYLDGEERYVPSWVDDEETARIALRVASEIAIAYACAPDEFITFTDGHVFIEGERYVTRGLNVQNQLPEAQADTQQEEHYEDWQTDPDAWKDG